MVDYDHQRVRPGGFREVGDEVNRDLLEREEDFRWNWVEGGYGWVGVYLVLLAYGTASDEVVDEGRESWPPEVVFHKGFGAKLAGVSEGWGFMKGSDERLMDVGGNVHTTLVIEGVVLECPVRERGSGEQRVSFFEVLESSYDKGIGGGRVFDVFRDLQVKGSYEDFRQRGALMKRLRILWGGDNRVWANRGIVVVGRGVNEVFSG